MPRVMVMVPFEWAMVFCECEMLFFAASQSKRDSSRSFSLRLINSVEDRGMAGLPLGRVRAPGPAAPVG